MSGTPMGAPPPPRSGLSGYPRTLMVYLTVVTAIGSISISTYLPSMHAIAVELNASMAEVQGTISVYLIGYAAGNLLHGPLADRYGRKPVLIVSFVIYFLASLAAIFAVSVGQIALLRLLQGLSSCAGPVLARAIIRDSFDGSPLMKAFSFLSMAVGVAPVIGPLIGGVLQGAFDWRASFVFMTVYSGVILAVAAVALGETRPAPAGTAAQPPRIRTTFATIIRNRVFVGWALSFALGTGGWFVFMAVSPFIFMDKLGASPEAYGVIYAVPILGFVLGGFVQRRVLRHLPPRHRVMVGFGLVLVGPLGLLATAGDLSMAGVLVPMFVFMLGSGVIQPTHMAHAMEPFAQVAGTASTLLGFIHLSVAALASSLGGLLYAGGMTEPALAMLALSVAGTAVVAVTRPWRAG